MNRISRKLNLFILILCVFSIFSTNTFALETTDNVEDVLPTRYNLAEHYTDKNLPGVGISIGLSRFFYQLREENLIKEDKQSISDVIVIPMNKEVKECIEVAKALRISNNNVDVYLENKKIKNKFKYVDRLQIPYAIVIGEEEVKNKKVTLKNMITGEQETIALEETIEKIKNNI